MFAQSVQNTSQENIMHIGMTGRSSGPGKPSIMVSQAETSPTAEAALRMLSLA